MVTKKITTRLDRCCIYTPYPIISGRDLASIKQHFHCQEFDENPYNHRGVFHCGSNQQQSKSMLQ
ncbi:hypothetical protein DERF_006947 [Dermatophagoides farinae]|uniref:Uncharacterized protein n=1 Tax=Dermatophagoides farinae TaxID=6954 RepID=A0A922L7H4_DERFA|nr:hypothetical protein DERF_006947 [Dermatophagoides farinae]